MANKNILVLVIVLLFGFSMTVSIPIIILSVRVTPNIIIEDTLDPILYTPANSSNSHGLNLNVDVGNIEIAYVYPPIDYFAKIEVVIRMIGREIVGKKYTDYFTIAYTNSSTISNFTLILKPNTDWSNISKWIKKDVIIKVNLNANVLFNVGLTINQRGDAKLFVPWGVNIKNVNLNINKGTALLDFNYCTIEGNLTGFADNGDITLRTNNVYYTQNSIWDFTNAQGEMLFNISHSKEMGSDVTSVVKTNSGVITLIFIDNVPEIAATIALINEDDDESHVVTGFIQGFLKYPNGSSYGISYTSNDFPAINTFNFMFYKPVLFGNYMINLDNQ